MTVYSMTQCVQKTQLLVASAIGVPAAKVVVKVTTTSVSLPPVCVTVLLLLAPV